MCIFYYIIKHRNLEFSQVYNKFESLDPFLGFKQHVCNVFILTCILENYGKNELVLLIFSIHLVSLSDRFCFEIEYEALSCCFNMQ